MNTRKKMYRTNSKIKSYLKEKGFHTLYLFPHLRHMKDLIFEDCGFDAIGWKNDDKRTWLFQFKTNLGCSKEQLKLYKKMNQKYFCVPCWITVWDKKKLNSKHKDEVEMFK